jgi:ferredoxin
VEVKSQAVFSRLDAEFETEADRETASPVGVFVKRQGPGASGGESVRATLSIDTRDCIGCDVCVAHCDRGVLRMIDGKALIDLRKLNQCDLDGKCVEVCPTKVVRLLVEPTTAAAAGPRFKGDGGMAMATLTDEEAASLAGGAADNIEKVGRARIESVGGPVVQGPPAAPVPHGPRRAPVVSLPIFRA